MTKNLAGGTHTQGDYLIKSDEESIIGGLIAACGLLGRVR